MVLLSNNRGGKRHAHKNAKICKLRLKLFTEKRYDLLWSHVMNKVNENKNKPKRKAITTRQQNNMNKKRAVSLIRDGDLSGAASALVSEAWSQSMNILSSK